MDYCFNSFKSRIVHINILNHFTHSGNHRGQILNVTHFFNLLHVLQHIVHVECPGHHAFGGGFSVFFVQYFGGAFHQRYHIALVQNAAGDALGVVAFAILALFFDDVHSMVSIWWHSSTFGYCLFIPPLIAWLVQQRLPGLRQLEPVAWPPGLVWLALGALAWLVGAAAGVAMVRHGALVMMLQGVTIALLGPAVARALIFPLFYAFFMVPFGEEIVPPLQLVTARLAMFFLDLSGVPAHMEGIFITTPTGYFEVAEACSGAKFLIAMTAYGVLVCNVCFRTWPRRIIFMTGALGLSVLANGVRAFATCEACLVPACGYCDRCLGCLRVICERCETGTVQLGLWPGDRQAHPHG